ncbi:permease [Paenibacillus eucommiae]|uniref:Uncharacterized membrane protein YraQ (UPF0718 family) n=1 Tax=Paenibacillus eucommiae TaxID=1355755 RepID=A0ABS4IY39_9BACL|nr:permease [Paenibacillus eucommiae]MBP1992502.1 uncharacterized membrane protein YraQ (UPF0718 family) [Paenibacillus eucommiae]
MRSFFSFVGINALFIAIVLISIVIAVNPGLFSISFGGPESLQSMQSLQSFKTIFISIILEAFPFILLGVLVSSFMQIFISEKTIQRFIPRNPILGILFACILGIVFPVCECGLILIIRRLIAKGMPLYIGVVFILVGPIVNPIVYAATYMAFRARPELLYARMGLALFVGVFIGLFIYYFVKKNQLKNSAATLYAGSKGDTTEHQHVRGGKFLSMMEHAGGEFFDMGKYLIFGCMVTAAIQTFVPRGSLVEIGQDPFSSQMFMMGLAYILSLCSTSDAFVASSFVSTFSAGSILTFLVFGPMLDFKSTLMLLSVFKTRFVILLSLLIILVVFVGANIAEQFFL